MGKKVGVLPITVCLSPPLYAALKSRAARDEMTLPELAETIMRDGLMSELDPSVRRQVQAEAKLMDFVDRTIRHLSQSGTWDEHVTALVFDRIAELQFDVYSEAVGGKPFHFGGADKTRINKRIGARIKRLLGAEVVLSRGLRTKGKPSRERPSLITSYTLLRPGKAGIRKRRGT